MACRALWPRQGGVHWANARRVARAGGEQSAAHAQVRALAGFVVDTSLSARTKAQTTMKYSLHHHLQPPEQRLSIPDTNLPPWAQKTMKYGLHHHLQPPEQPA
eukprot:284138-Prymnesium_polylepis.1